MNKLTHKDEPEEHKEIDGNKEIVPMKKKKSGNANKQHVQPTKVKKTSVDKSHSTPHSGGNGIAHEVSSPVKKVVAAAVEPKIEKKQENKVQVKAQTESAQTKTKAKPEVIKVEEIPAVPKNESTPKPPQTKAERQDPRTISIQTDEFDLLSCSVQGESHLATGKECQDFSACWNDATTSICIVSDGHGGDRYFRSRIGAEKATMIALDTVRRFLKEDITSEMIRGKGFKAFGIKNEREIQNQDERQIVALFDQLFRSIVSQWQDAIEIDAKHNPVSEWEAIHVKPEYLEQLRNLNELEKIYGCTLMTYVRTKDLWFAFQIGDGKCIAFDVNGQNSAEPIPWDDQCFLNKTTSLCGSHAADEFRFCCQGDGCFPCAVFMGSDGMDDTFHTERDLTDFYVKLGKFTLENGCKQTATEMGQGLPVLSKRGSQDDMSVAFVIERGRFAGFLPILMKDQLDAMDQQIQALEEEIQGLNQKAESLSGKAQPTESDKINLQYSLKDISSKSQELSLLKGRREKLHLSLENKQI